ncbi:MAG: hypothetical protein ACI4LO_00780, partial [Anaerovoracaceae bacterium]
MNNFITIRNENKKETEGKALAMFFKRLFCAIITLSMVFGTLPTIGFSYAETEAEAASIDDLISINLGKTVRHPEAKTVNGKTAYYYNFSNPIVVIKNIDYSVAALTVSVENGTIQADTASITNIGAGNGTTSATWIRPSSVKSALQHLNLVHDGTAAMKVTVSVALAEGTKRSSLPEKGKLIYNIAENAYYMYVDSTIDKSVYGKGNSTLTIDEADAAATTYQFAGMRGTLALGSEATKSADKIGVSSSDIWESYSNSARKAGFIVKFSGLNTIKTVTSSDIKVGHTVTFDAGRNASTSNATLVTEADGKLSAIPSATFTGSPSATIDLEGWYDAEGNKITKDTVFIKDTALTSRWNVTVNSATYVTDKNKKMGYRFNGGRLDMRGTVDDDGSNWLMTTFNDGGYTTKIKVGSTEGTINSLKGNRAEGTVDGVKVSAGFDFKYDGNYLQINYKVTNTSSAAKAVSFGSYADIKIGNLDRAPISVLTLPGIPGITGFKMVDDNGTENNPDDDKQFTFYGRGINGVTDIDNVWYGYYSHGSSWVFKSGVTNSSSDTSGTSYSVTQTNWPVLSGVDSGASWSWVDETIAAGETKTYAVLIG